MNENLYRFKFNQLTKWISTHYGEHVALEAVEQTNDLIDSVRHDWHCVDGKGTMEESYICLKCTKRAVVLTSGTGPSDRRDNRSWGPCKEHE